MEVIPPFLKTLSERDLLLTAGYLLVLLSVWTGSYLFLKRKGGRELGATIYALEAVLFVVVGIFAYRFLENLFLKILFRDFVLSVAFLMLAKAVFTLLSVGRFWKLLTYLALFGALAVEVAVVFTLNPYLLEVLLHVRRFLILLALFPIVYSLTGLIPYRRLKKYVRIFTAFLFLAVGVLWELGVVNFDMSAFVGIGLIVAFTLAYIWLASHGRILLVKKLRELTDNEDDAETLADAAGRLSLLGLFYVYYLSAVYFLDLRSLIEVLKRTTLLDTELVSISLYSVLVSLYLFLVLYNLVLLLKKVLKLLFPKDEREEKGGSLEAVVYNLGILFAVAVSLSSLGLTWKVVLPLAGALGIGLGFGLQTILNNYVSGFILMFSRIVKVGDFVEIPGSAGKFINNNSDTIFGRVENISVLTTQIKTLDGVDILVPNSVFIGNRVVNYSLRNPYVRVRFPFGVAYSSDPKKVKEILIKLAYDCPWAKNFYKPPQVWFTEMGDGALIFYLMFWVDIREIWKSRHATLSYSLTDWVYTNAWYRLKEAGIEIPFPQQDVWFRNSLKVVFEKEDRQGGLKGKI